jgi:hypothetical protein
MTNTEKLLEEAITAANNVAPTIRSYYTNLVGLRELVADKESAYKSSLANHPAPMPLDVQRGLNTVFCEARGSSEFLNLKNALAYLEGLPEAAEAEAILAPLVAKVRELEEQLHAEQAAVAAAAEARRSAIEKATAKAIAEVEARFAEPEPAAPAGPPPLVRGRQKLEAVTA